MPRVYCKHCGVDTPNADQCGNIVGMSSLKEINTPGNYLHPSYESFCIYFEKELSQESIWVLFLLYCNNINILLSEYIIFADLIYCFLMD